ADLLGQAVLVGGPLRPGRLAGKPLIKSLPAHLQDPAQPLHAELGPMFGDEPPAAGHRPISLAKYWSARRRISFSCSSAATRPRSRRSSVRSSRSEERRVGKEVGAR